MPFSDALPSIEAYLARARDERLEAQLDAIFFEASGTKSFTSADERAAFRGRWLGRYLDRDPAHAFLAISNAGSPDCSLAGYLVGTLDDPAQDTRFDDLAYFKALSHLTSRYPAQLHVNLAPEWRGKGVGSALVSAFCDHAQAAGAPGVHVFTGRGMENVRFYEAAGFYEVGSVVWNGRDLVMLGRSLH